MEINLNKVPYNYDPLTSTISVSERDVRFATTYEVLSKKGNKKIFELSHSTGPEFDPKTRWVYKDADGILLEVSNDPITTRKLASNYLAAKTGR